MNEVATGFLDQTRPDGGEYKHTKFSLTYLSSKPGPGQLFLAMYLSPFSFLYSLPTSIPLLAPIPKHHLTSSKVRRMVQKHVQLRRLPLRPQPAFCRSRTFQSHTKPIYLDPQTGQHSHLGNHGSRPRKAPNIPTRHGRNRCRYPCSRAFRFQFTRFRRS